MRREMKVCTRCEAEKSVDEFYKCRGNKDGLQYQCKGCASAQKKRYYADNRDRITERNRSNYADNREQRRMASKTYRDNNKESIAERKREYQKANKEVISEYRRAYYTTNREAILEQKKSYYQKNRESILNSVKMYRKSNPDARRIAAQKRRALEKGAYVEGAYIPTHEELAEFYGVGCLVQGCLSVNTTYDHIKPLSKGGKHELWNLQPLCASHNSSKNVHHDTDYRNGFIWIARLEGIGDVTCKVDYRFDSQRSSL